MPTIENELSELALAAGFNPELGEFLLTELGCILMCDQKLLADVNKLAAYEFSLHVPGNPPTGDESMTATLAAYSHAELCALRNRIFLARHRELVQERADEYARRARIKARILRRP